MVFRQKWTFLLKAAHAAPRRRGGEHRCVRLSGGGIVGFGSGSGGWGRHVVRERCARGRAKVELEWRDPGHARVCIVDAELDQIEYLVPSVCKHWRERAYTSLSWLVKRSTSVSFLPEHERLLLAAQLEQLLVSSSTPS